MGPSELLLTQLDEAYNRRAWHGPNLRGSIRGLDAATAAHRPARNRHNIQEVVVHCAYWKYAVRRRLTGEARASFPLKGSNWCLLVTGIIAHDLYHAGQIQLLKKLSR